MKSTQRGKLSMTSQLAPASEIGEKRFFDGYHLKITKLSLIFQLNAPLTIVQNHFSQLKFLDLKLESEKLLFQGVNYKLIN